ncbi:MAG: glutamate--tRNA ligase, partial [Solirubrobacterales bacterium]
LLHGPDGRKLSKRHGAASVQELRERGFLPAAIRNYLALLGWGADDDATLIPTDELVERFRLEDVGSAAAIFDEKKLRWINGRYMREMTLDAYTVAVAAHVHREVDARLREACEIAQDKAQTLEEVWPLIRFAFEEPVEDEAAWSKVMKEGAREGLEAAHLALEGCEAFDAEAVEAVLSPLPEKLGVKPGRLYQPIRVAITGTTISPGIFESLALLGREASLQRITAALERLRDGQSGGPSFSGADKHS